MEQIEFVLGLQRFESRQVRNHLESVSLARLLGVSMPPRLPVSLNPTLSRNLRQVMLAHGMSEENIEHGFAAYDRDVAAQNHLDNLTNASGEPHRRHGRDQTRDEASEFSWTREQSPAGAAGEHMMKMVFHIAEDQSRQDGYVHRGVSCSSCDAYPIRGARYRCANCFDFDLCENCEGLQTHPMTHVFIKILVPMPSLGTSKHVQPVFYPGKPAAFQKVLPRSLSKSLEQDTGYERAEVEAMWDQFRVTSSSDWANDPSKLGLAINRRTFNRCLVPSNGNAFLPPQPNLVFDRLFAFYDSNGDGLIGFAEYVKGIACVQNKAREERMRRVFAGYDMDGDGYIGKRDLLRLFRAYYVLSKERSRDLVTGIEAERIDAANLRDAVAASQPMSAAFTSWIRAGEALGDPSRAGEGKRPGEYGDLLIADGKGVIVESGRDLVEKNSGTADSSATSSPISEQFGTTIPEGERDAGQELLYQLSKQGLNEMIDRLFAEKEALAAEVLQTRAERRRVRLGGREEPERDDSALEALRMVRASSNPFPEPQIDATLAYLRERRMSNPVILGRLQRERKIMRAEREQAEKDGKTYGELHSNWTARPVTAPAPAAEYSPPSAERLKRLKYLDALEKEGEARGGLCRMDFGEFRAALDAAEGKVWGVLSGWVELMTF
ncbi:MAG: hypothetical protein M1832_000799 [Thelocarpon impressellum]|nr:MAG: hypothetical protein M1832_000799 [Thelocarpon impressellum]